MVVTRTSLHQTVRVGGWEFVEDASGTEIGRRLYLPESGGWFYEWYSVQHGDLTKRGSFAPRLSDWLEPLEALIGRAISESPLPETLAKLSHEVIRMSGTIKTVQEAIDALMEQDARLTQEVADEGAAVAKATAMLASIPQLIDAAVQQALANGPLNEAQQSAFSSLRDHLKAEADTFDTQTTALDAAATPAAPPPA